MNTSTLVVKLVVAPVVWLRNVLYEKIYTGGKVMGLGNVE